MPREVVIAILEIFVESQERFYDVRRDMSLRMHCIDEAWAGGKSSRLRLEAREDRARSRPPCPHCGAAVERVGGTAKIPKYCSHKCMRAATWARWYAKHGGERNIKRRRTGRCSPTKRAA
jgi:endogenous inhibitor of DNA gyrase (YacG/DUF329 family)